MISSEIIKKSLEMFLRTININPGIYVLITILFSYFISLLYVVASLPHVDATNTRIILAGMLIVISVVHVTLFFSIKSSQKFALFISAIPVFILAIIFVPLGLPYDIRSAKNEKYSRCGLSTGCADAQISILVKNEGDEVKENLNVGDLDNYLGGWKRKIGIWDEGCSLVMIEGSYFWCSSNQGQVTSKMVIDRNKEIMEMRKTKEDQLRQANPSMGTLTEEEIGIPLPPYNSKYALEGEIFLAPERNYFRIPRIYGFQGGSLFLTNKGIIYIIHGFSNMRSFYIKN